MLLVGGLGHHDEVEVALVEHGQERVHVAAHAPAIGGHRGDIDEHAARSALTAGLRMHDIAMQGTRRRLSRGTTAPGAGGTLTPRRR